MRGVVVDSLDRKLDPHDNALNLIRLVLAGLVIVSHTWPIAGYGDDPSLGDMKLGLIAVGGFFTISGYLITRSRHRSTFWSYSWRRALRILPGYWVCLVFTAFVVAAIGGAVRGGWTPGAAWHFVYSNFDFRNGDLLIGKTLAGAPFPEAWNGSLWTLFYEVGCYVLLGLAFLVPFVRRLTWLLPILFVASTICSLVVHAQGVTGATERWFLLGTFFLAGASLFSFSERIPLSWQFGAAAAALFFLCSILGVGRSLSPLPLAYLLLWLGAALPKNLRKLGSKNDYSYGTYLYAFPVQQTLVLTGLQHAGPVAFILVSVAVTAPLAVLSWHLVERPVQRLKSWRLRVPGRSQPAASPTSRLAGPEGARAAVPSE
jgi:peptidoglycan/LPS O-acetylase OafA/YrhL